ncbi:MAG: hypothetical protein M1816_006260 [Peltula sp. TS41687]|nr:MAG: hypothetical protein M1816_006260 [Peltula sp. TS41687]
MVKPQKKSSDLSKRTSHTLRKTTRTDHGPLHSDCGHNLTLPNPQLLNIISAFLTQYGFDGTCREFAIERQQKIEREGWPVDDGRISDKSLPRLIELFVDLQKEKKEKDLMVTEKGEKEVSTKVNGKAGGTGGGATSHDASNDSTGSDRESKIEVVAPRKSTVPRNEKAKKTATSESTDTTSSSSSDENDVKFTKKFINPKKLKHTQGASSESATDSDSSSPSSDDDVPVSRQSNVRKDKKDNGVTLDQSTSKTKVGSKPEQKPKGKVTQPKANKRDTSSDSSSTTSSDDDEPVLEKPNVRKDKKGSGTPLDQSTKAKVGSTSEQKSKGKVTQPKVTKPKTSSGSKTKVESTTEQKPKASKDTSSNSKTKVGSTPEQKPKGKVPEPKVVKREPSSDSSSSSSSDSDVSDQKGKPKEVVTGKVSSGSSATLVADKGGKAVISKSDSDTSTSTSSSDDSDSPFSIPKKQKPSNIGLKRKRSPERAIDGEANQSKKARHSVTEPTQPTQNGRNSKPQNKPFSRIPADVQVDERLKSNAYVPYDYAERAHQDLVVTKGKSFTKEKNKKKRGSYRGGTIDIHGKKGIKFD